MDTIILLLLWPEGPAVSQNVKFRVKTFSIIYLTVLALNLSLSREHFNLVQLFLFAAQPEKVTTLNKKLITYLSRSDPLNISHTSTTSVCYVTSLWPLTYHACYSLRLFHPCRLAQSLPPRLCVPSLPRRLATRSWRWMAAAFWVSRMTKPSGSWSHHGIWWWRSKTWAACHTPGQLWARPSGLPARRSQRALPTAAWQGEVDYLFLL